MQAKYVEMEDLRKQEETRQIRIMKAKEDLFAAEVELANLPTFEPPKNEIVCWILHNCSISHLLADQFSIHVCHV